jgi:hypothetical protein
VMVFVRKDPEKTQKRRNVVLVNSFRVFPFDDASKNIEGADNDVVILPE